MGTFLSTLVSLLISMISVLMSLLGILASPGQNHDNVEDVRNVIYMIGDGMGFNHLEKTKAERDIALTMESFPVQGSAMTRSLSSAVTDSAAGGTALATGVRTGNGIIGAYYDDPESLVSYPKNILELCHEKGMMTGIITTDVTSGATPAAFSAHSSSRNNTEDISADQISSDIDLIWGKLNDVVTKSAVEASGYTYISTYDEMMALPDGSRSFAQFFNSLWCIEPKPSTPNLRQMAIRAVDILDDTEEGFFLMIEGAHIDKHSHDMNSEGMTEALEEFDLTVSAMLDYAKKDKHTIIIITADHETGGITASADGYVYSNGSHSGVDVPLFVYGCSSIIEHGQTINNYDIPIKIARVLGFAESEFPMTVSVK